jgi:hypothetical protein
MNSVSSCAHNPSEQPTDFLANQISGGYNFLCNFLEKELHISAPGMGEGA